MFEFIKKAFLVGQTILSTLMGVKSLSCISMTNKECKVRREIINVNSNEPAFYPFIIKISKCNVTISMIHTQKYVFLML